MGNCSASSRTNNYEQPASAASIASSTISPADSTCVVHDGPVLGMCYSEDGRKLLSCGDDKRIAVIDLEKMLSNKYYTPDGCFGHTKAVNRVRCYGSKFWSCSRDLSLRMVLSFMYFWL